MSVSSNSQEKNIEAGLDIEAAAKEVELVDNQRPAVFKTLLHELTCILLFTLTVGCATISTGAYQISVDTIAQDFDVNGGRLTWSVAAVSLANGASLLVAGSISDIVGRKNCIVLGLVGYSVATLIAGFMHSFVSLCVFRGLSGFFLAFAVPSSGGLLSSFYSPSVRKNRAMACFAAGSPIGMAVGLVVGGVAVQALSWRAIHYFFAIVYGLMSVLVVLFVPNDGALKFSKDLLKDAGKRLLRVDYVGGLMSTISLILILFALNQSSVPATGWNTGYIIATLVVGCVLLIAFVIYEIYVPKNPMMPMFVWKNRNFSLSMAVMGFCWMCFIGCSTYFSILYFEQVLRYSTLHTAACVLPMAVCGVLANFVAAMILHIIPGKIILTFATLSFLAAAIIWATITEHVSYWRGPFEAYCLSVIGADLAFNVVNMITINSVNVELQSSAQGILQTTTQVAGALGMALASTIVQQKNPAFGQPIDYSKPSVVTELFHSFRYAFYFAIGCASAAAVISLFVRVGTSGTKKALQEKAKYDLEHQEDYEKK